METTEASRSERRNTSPLRLRFSLRLLLVVVAIAALGFAIIAELRRREVALQRARATVPQQLLLQHWEWAWGDADPQYLGQMSKEFRGGGPVWSFEVIDATGETALFEKKPAPSLDAFEQRAIEQIRAGKTEVGRVSWDGEIRYVQAITLAVTCLGCHTKPHWDPAAAGATPRVVVSARLPAK